MFTNEKIENPKISVIVPVYNAEMYIRRCIDSLLSQTFLDFEILLVNDGSPDKSGVICDEYALKDGRVRVFHKDNGGVSSARQCGIDNAIGEYIIHTDPDDWVEAEMLERLYAKAKEEDADMVICDFYEEYNNKQIYRSQCPTALDNDTVLKELFHQLHGSCCNKLVKQNCYKMYNVSFDLSLSYCEDLYFNASLLMNKLNIAYLPNAFYHYDCSINSTSIIRNYTRQSLQYDIELFEKFTKMMKNTTAYESVQINMAYLIVHRAFHGNVFSSYEFKEKCSKYFDYVIKKEGINILYKILYCFSCKGYYKIMYSIYYYLKILKKCCQN